MKIEVVPLRLYCMSTRWGLSSVAEITARVFHGFSSMQITGCAESTAFA